jgi:hypothetical protein
MEDVHTLVIASYLFGKSCMTSFLDLDGDTHSFPVYRSFHCLFETGMLGALKLVVIPHCRAPLQCFGIMSFPSWHMQPLVSTS